MKTTIRRFLLIVVLFAMSATLTAQAGFIVSVDPNQVQQGQNLAVVIEGQGTHFEEASYTSIWLSQGSQNIPAYGYYPYDNTLLIVWFDIPGDADSGLYDLNVYNDIDGTLTLYDNFWITLGNIVSVDPNSAQQGQSLAVAITGQDTHFFQQGSQATIWFSQGSPTIYARDAWAVSDTLLIAEFDIPDDTTTGLQDLSLYNDTDGTLTLYDGFTITPYNPVLTSITPNGAYQGQSLTVTITGQNTHFLLQDTDFQQGVPKYWFDPFSQATPTTSIIWLAQGSSTIYSKDGGAAGETLLMAQFDIPADANAGLWDVVVPTRLEGKLTLQDGFTVAQPGDWTGDGKVNFLDFAVVANNWLEGFE